MHALACDEDWWRPKKSKYSNFLYANKAETDWVSATGV